MKQEADSLGVFGWVRNKDRGVVQAVIQADADKLEKIIDLCKKGPETSWVKNVAVNSVSTSKIYSEFTILI